jgi:O-antigen ligase
MCIYYLRKRTLIKSFGIILLTLAIVTALLLPAHNGNLNKRAISIGDSISAGFESDDSAGSGRMYIWKETIKLIPDNWAFGVGPDNLIYKGIYFGPLEPIDKAHNIYLETAVTMGIPALLFYLAFLSFFIFRRCKNDKEFMFFSMISTYLMQGFFNIDVIMVLPLFWIVLGLYQANMERENWQQEQT